MTTIPLSQIIYDSSVHSRDGIHDVEALGRLVDAIRAGTEIPPPVLDRRSKRIADGLYRVTAYQELFPEDPDHLIQVELQTFRSDADILLYSMRANSSHGRPLTKYDRAQCMAKGQALDISVEQISLALHMTVEKLSEIYTKKVAYVGVGDNIEPQVMRGTARNLAGHIITPMQAVAASRTSGWPQLTIVRQLINIVEGDILDYDNQRLVEELVYLRELLNKLELDQG